MTSNRAGKLTIGQLARASGLARSSLIHYEALGLLLPAARTEAGYRMYGEAQIELLQAIRRYRDAGLTFSEIGELLAANAKGASSHGGGPAKLLEHRLAELCNEVERLRT